MLMLENILDSLKKLRIKLLDKDDYISYQKIKSFLKNPLDNEYDIKIKKKYKDLLEKLRGLYNEDYQQYKTNILEGQLEIWDITGKTYDNLNDVEKEIKQINLIENDKNFSKGVKESKKILNNLSKAYAIFTKFENALGIDQYLSDINKEDINLLNSKISNIRRIANNKLKNYKDIFQEKWNITVIYRLINHFYSEDDDNEECYVCRNLPSNQDKVIFFLTDGLGYTQYKWNQKYDNISLKKYSYNQNILYWLRNDEDFYEYILGSSLISDTAAGLSQIFTGKLPKETGVISSKIYNNDIKKNFYNIKYGDGKYIKKHNNFYHSIDHIKRKFYTNSNLQKNYFYKYCFGNNSVKKVTPAERIFPYIYKNIQQGFDKELYTIYYTKFDRSGHPTGGFSKHELYEHKKFNSLLTNFIIQLARKKPSLFNGSTSIIFTSDHGMAMTSEKMISRHEFRDLKIFNKDVKIIENNRALLFYNIYDDNIEKSKKYIKEIFKKNNIKAELLSKKDNIVKNLIYESSSNKYQNCPDIVALLNEDGLIYSQDIDKSLYHYGGHGGRSNEEIFVPLILINLTNNLRKKIKKRYVKYQ